MRHFRRCPKCRSTDLRVHKHPQVWTFTCKSCGHQYQKVFSRKGGG